MDPVQFFKCLADETRLKILMLVTLEQELCVCELMAALDESQPKISRHLALLRKHKLLTDTKHSQWVYYKLNPALPLWASKLIQQSTDNNQEFLHLNHTKLINMGDRPERVKQCCN